MVATSVTYSTKRRRNNERRRRLACPLSVVAEYEDDQRPTSPRSLRSKRKSAVKSGSPVFSFRSDPPTFRLALIALSNGGRARVRSLDWLRSLYFFFRKWNSIEIDPNRGFDSSHLSNGKMEKFRCKKRRMKILQI